jgi:hypothetical protein
MTVAPSPSTSATFAVEQTPTTLAPSARELYGAEPHSPRRAEDQHATAGLVVEVRELDERLSRRRARDAETSGLVERDRFGQARQLIGAYDRFVGVAAELLSREVGRADDACADRQIGDVRAQLDDLPRKVEPDDQRPARADEPMREPDGAPLPHLPVDGVHADRTNADANIRGADGARRQLDERERYSGRRGCGDDHGLGIGGM